MALNGINGHGINGNGVNGDSINGDGVNGNDNISNIINEHDINGINGNGANQHGVNGHGVNGHGVNGHGVNGHGVNGHCINDIDGNVHDANGHDINGNGVNGDGINGGGINGSGINGGGINGSGINGDIDHSSQTNGYRSMSEEVSPQPLSSLLPHSDHSVIAQEIPLLLPTVYRPLANGKEPPRQRGIAENGTSRRSRWARPSNLAISRRRGAGPGRPVLYSLTTQHAQTQTDDPDDQDSLGERVVRNLRGIHHEVLEIREVPVRNPILVTIESGPYGITPMIDSTDDDDDEGPILGDALLPDRRQEPQGSDAGFGSGDTPVPDRGQEPQDANRGSGPDETSLSGRGQEPQESNRSSGPGDTRPETGGQELRDSNGSVEPDDPLLPGRGQHRRDSNRSFEPRLGFGGSFNTPEPPRGLNLQGAIKKLDALFRRNHSRSSEETKSSGSPSPALRHQLSFPDLHHSETSWVSPFRRAKSRSSSDTPAILRRPGPAISRPPTPIPGRHTPPSDRTTLPRAITYHGDTAATTANPTTTLTRSAAIRRRGSSPSVDYPPGPFRYPTNASPNPGPRSIQSTPAKAYNISTSNNASPPSPIAAPKLRRASCVAGPSPLFDMAFPEPDGLLQVQAQVEVQQQQLSSPGSGVLPQEGKDGE